MANPLKDLSFQILFDAAADAMLLVDNAGHVIQANLAAQQLLEYSEEAICKLEVEALMPASFRGEHYHHRDAFFKNPEKRPMGNGRDLFALTSSGKQLAVDIGLSPLRVNGRTYILITFYLADKRREAEQAVRTSMERLELAKQAAGLGVFDFDFRENIVHLDERMQELWGGESEKSVTYDQFLAVVHPDDYAAKKMAIDRASDPVNNGAYNTEFRIIKPSDGTEHWIAITGRVHFKEGHATRLVGIVQDITAQKILEKSLQQHRLENKAIFTQQIAAHTASAIAHELNQPLAAISAYSDVALHALNDTSSNPEKLKHALKGCIVQAQRAGTSLHELMAFLKEGKLVTERFDLNQIVKEALTIAKNEGYKEFHPILVLEENTMIVLANRIQVQKVLINLLINAVEAMQGVGVPTSKITITVRSYKDKSMAHVTVQDNGPGLNNEVASRVFEPFFTTKPTGIGMGLSISRTLIEANGGQLWFEPNSDFGAEFHFTLPFAQ